MQGFSRYRLSDCPSCGPVRPCGQRTEGLLRIEDLIEQSITLIRIFRTHEPDLNGIRDRLGNKLQCGRSVALQKRNNARLTGRSRSSGRLIEVGRKPAHVFPGAAGGAWIDFEIGRPLSFEDPEAQLGIILYTGSVAANCGSIGVSNKDETQECSAINGDA